MTNRVLVKVRTLDQFLVFRIVTEERSDRREFYVTRAKLLKLEQEGVQHYKDGPNYATFEYHSSEGTVHIRFCWLNCHGDGALTGRAQTVILNCDPLLEFASMSAYKRGPKKFSALSKQLSANPKLTFRSGKSLRMVVHNKKVMRKLLKFLSNHFHWYSTSEIVFSSDWTPYSFFFQEYRNGGIGMFGGVILHRQDDMHKAYYDIHT